MADLPADIEDMAVEGAFREDNAGTWRISLVCLDIFTHLWSIKCFSQLKNSNTSSMYWNSSFFWLFFCEGILLYFQNNRIRYEFQNDITFVLVLWLSVICCRTFHSIEKIENYNLSDQSSVCFIIKSSWIKYLSNVYGLLVYFIMESLYCWYRGWWGRRGR